MKNFCHDFCERDEKGRFPNVKHSKNANRK